MIGITGYKQAEAISFSELPKLQPGGYVVKILNVKVESTDWGSRLAIQLRKKLQEQAHTMLTQDGSAV